MKLLFSLTFLYQRIQAFSLDVVAGSCVSSLFIARYLEVELSVFVLFALGSATWVIYTIDHLADAQKLKDNAISLRHQLHYRYRKILFALILFVVLANSINLFYLPLPILKAGLGVFVGVLCYFLLLKLAKGEPSLFKELTIAMIYVVAISLAPLTLYAQAWHWGVGVLLVEYFLLAMINLLEFSVFEAEIDELENHSSVVRKLGKTQVMNGIKMAIVLLVFIIFYVFFFYMFDFTLFFVQTQLCILVMLFTLSIIIIFPSFFKKNERYRILGDMVFIFPICLL